MRLNLRSTTSLNHSSEANPPARTLLLTLILGSLLAAVTAWQTIGRVSAAPITADRGPTAPGAFPAVSACPPNWNIVSSVNPSTNNYLYGVAAVSANDVWAVGNYYNANVPGTGAGLFEHWDGATWTQVPGANTQSNRQGQMNAVAAVASNDIWAVGLYYPGTAAQTLIEHWDGTQWQVVPSPSSSGLNELLGVTAIAADDVWAVGHSTGDHASLAEHWNGSYWAIVPSSPPSGGPNYILNAVAGTAGNDVWAVGYIDQQSGQTAPFAAHWNGTAWSQVAVPRPGDYYTSYYGVTAQAANDVWAVGAYSNDSGSTYLPLMAHWNGTNWTSVSGNSSHPFNSLRSVSAAAPDDIWAVGLASDCDLCLQFHTLIEHYDGTQWSVVPSPDGNNQFNRLRGVAAVSSSDVWTVGLSDQYGYPYYSDTLVERQLCAPPPTATGTPPTSTSTATSSPSATPTVCTLANTNYAITRSAGATVVPATTDVGLHCDDCQTIIPLPFQYSLYGQPFNQVMAGSNGTLGFVRNNNPNAGACLPSQSFDYAILPFWEAMHLDPSGGSCALCGIFTSVEGSAPNRIFNIEWRSRDYYYTTQVNFEVRLYEGAVSGHFDVIYNRVPTGFSQQVTIGVQKGQGFLYTQYVCWTQPPVITDGTMLTFVQPPCGGGGTSTVTPPPSTATRTSTPPQITTTRTASPVATGTGTALASATTSTTALTTSTAVATAYTTQTPCAVQFSDVQPTDYFYAAVSYLSCNGSISGYADGTFRPYTNTTRGQLSKIVVLAEGWVLDPSGGPHFTDVPATNAFYAYIETARNHGIISGYANGTFRPGNNVTRAQLAKIVVSAEGWTIDTTGGPHFLDVLLTDTYYGFVETAYNHGIISGYADNTFRPGSNATRGQIAKIIYTALGGQR